MNRFVSYIQSKKVIISDGAWGTMLQQAGLGAGECPEEYNLKFPGKVQKIAESYLAAGSEIIITNSFGASPWKLENYKLADKVEEINKTAAKISKNAVSNHQFVMASIGPSGKFLQPLGEVTPEEMKEGFLRQARALADGGADAILVETMSDLEEARIAVQAAKLTGLPVVCTMTFNPGNRGYRTMMGTDIKTAARGMEEAGAMMIGANCGSVSPAQMVEVAGEFHEASSLPVIVRLNAGMPVLINGETSYPATPEEMADVLPLLVQAGAKVIGGCCGTNPSHIRAMAAKARELT